MRELAIGDIHGCSDSFATLLSIIRPQREDVIVLLGDYVNRGPDSCKVIEMILELNRKTTVVALAGNHEKMMLRARSDPEMLAELLAHGGKATLDSYARSGYAPQFDAIPNHHWDFIANQTLDYWETDDRIFVHGSIDPEVDLNEQPDFLLFWQPFANPTIHKSGKQMICGHASQKSGFPAIFERGVCIDTWACGGGWLTCLDTIEQKFIQTNERGEHRSFDVHSLLHE